MSSKKEEYYRWFTYSFLHANTSHFVNNLVMQVLLGLLLEMEHKSVRILIIYVFGCIVGALFHSLFSCHPLVGASGGIYALIGAGAIKIKHHLRYKGQLRRMCNLILSIATTVIIVIDMALTGYNWATCRTNISLWAHVGGLLAGISLGSFVFDKYKESWAVERAERNGKPNSFQQLKADVKCCNYTNCIDGKIE